MLPSARESRAVNTAALLESSVDRIPVRRGKVRDICDFDDRLLFVASDCISAFDCDKESTPPALPNDFVSRTRTKHTETFELLVGETFPWT